MVVTKRKVYKGFFIDALWKMIDQEGLLMSLDLI